MSRIPLCRLGGLTGIVVEDRCLPFGSSLCNPRNRFRGVDHLLSQGVLRLRCQVWKLVIRFVLFTPSLGPLLRSPGDDTRPTFLSGV